MNDVEKMNETYQEWVRANKTALQAAYAEAYYPLFEEFCHQTYLHDNETAAQEAKRWDVYDEDTQGGRER